LGLQQTALNPLMEAEMESYKNLSGNSGVVAFEIGGDFIAVQFRNNAKIYIYSYQKIDSNKIEEMKRLAVAGQGLSTFINRNPDVKNGYSL